MDHTFSRRDTMTGMLALAAGLAVAPSALRADEKDPKPAGKPAFRYSLNTSTIRGQKLPIAQVVELAAKAGYDAVEPWIGELDKHVKDGGTLKDLGKLITDKGLTCESAIGFPKWIVDDPAERAKGLEECKRNMEMLQQLGGKRIAAPPVGAQDAKNAEIPLLTIAERFRAVLELGEKMAIQPQLELWGFSKNLSKLGETALVAIESKHAQSCVLADIYHLYKGGSGFDCLKLLSGTALAVFHVNDYPEIEPAKIKDADRVFPGDGVAPLQKVFRDLHAIGFKGVLSLELFNNEYWKQDPFQVAKTGLEKTKEAVAKAFA